ncbi:MAG: carbohydrate-binding domain-containing protein [Ruminococcus sp.]|nr:carbohydrate-binding domain-containing protein [Ruminococcus sp.]
MKRIVVLLLALMLTTASLAACQKEEQTASPDTTVQATQSATTAAAQSKATEAQTSNNNTSTTKLTQGAEVVTTANVTSDGAINATDLFSDRDLKQTADLSEAVYYDLSDNNNITITSEGVYVISGSADNASVIVEAGDNDKVQLVLNGVTITNESAPAIYVKSADKVFVTTVENTTSTLTVSGTFTADGDTNTDAVIFSKDDLILNGLGTLNISSSDNGISGKDDIKITGGTIGVTCISDAIEANESIAVADGNITVNANKDGLHAENDEDNTTGYIYICGGTFNITTSGDCIQATTVCQIDGGNITASGSEGIEATYVQINGGTVNITASDDGINGSNKSSAYSVTVEINGGDVTVNMGQGDTDGIDSNGNLYINGGTVNVNANSPFDYDGEGKLSGGTVYVNGTQTTELTNQMMGGGPGGMGGGMGGQMPGGNMGGRGGFAQ